MKGFVRPNEPVYGLKDFRQRNKRESNPEPLGQ